MSHTAKLIGLIVNSAVCGTVLFVLSGIFTKFGLGVGLLASTTISASAAYGLRRAFT